VADKGVASWERVEDTNNGEPSFKILGDVMTPPELFMSQVDSMAQHASVRWLSSRESRKG